jgi:uncharacterized caspase-like protein
VKTVLIIIFSFFVCDVYSQHKGAIVISQNKDTTPINFSKRYALVIGNANYKDNKLKNPVNDANAVAVVLRKYGFEVMLDTNVDRKKMNLAINKFGDSITKGSGVTFFYFSGHGLQYNAENYMLPLNNDIHTDKDIEDEAVKMSKLYEKISTSRNGLNVVILDACRNNPFYQLYPNYVKGLSQFEVTPNNTLIFFATSPNKLAADGKGSNSPFTQSLVETIKNSDSLELFQIIKQVIRQVKSETHESQVPWIAGSPDKDFVFKITPSKRKPVLHILSIGISKYNNSMASLAYARKDAIDFASSFKKQQGSGDELYESIQTTLLIDEKSTYNAILRSLNNIKENCRPGDLVLIYYSGHGFVTPDNEYHFALSDYKLTGSSLSALSSSVSYRTVAYYLSSIPCKSLLFFDTDRFENNFQVPLQRLSESETGVTVIASSSPGQYSYESSILQQGIFTRAVIEGINGAADLNKSGYVTVQSLFNYISARVEQLTREYQITQTATIYNTPGQTNYIIWKAVRK